MQTIERRSRGNLLALAAKWMLSASAEYLDPSGIPPGGSGRPKFTRRWQMGTGAAAAATATAVVFWPRGNSVEEQQQAFRASAGTRRELIETKRGVRDALVVPHKTTLNFRNRYYLENDTDFTEILLLNEPIALMTQTGPTNVFPRDGTDRYITVRMTDAPGTRGEKLQTHFISLGIILAGLEPRFGPYPAKKERQKQLEQSITEAMNVQLIRRFLLPENFASLHELGQREQLEHVTRVYSALVDRFGTDGLPVQLRNFDHEKAAARYGELQTATSSRIEQLRTPFGERPHIILPPFTSGVIQNNNYVQNGLSFMEIAVDITQIQLLYQPRTPRILEPDRINRYIALRMAQSPGVSHGNSQEHVISLGDIIAEYGQLLEPPITLERERAIRQLLQLDLSTELLKRLRFPPELIDDPTKKQETDQFAQQALVVVAGSMSKLDNMPVKITNIDFPKALQEYEAFKNRR